MTEDPGNISGYVNKFAVIVQKTIALRIHAYSNVLEISPQKTKSFQVQILTFFHITAQDIDCGYSLEPPRRGYSNVLEISPQKN